MWPCAENESWILMNPWFIRRKWCSVFTISTQTLRPVDALLWPQTSPPRYIACLIWLFFPPESLRAPHFSSQIDTLCWDATFQAFDNQTIMYNCRTPRAPVPPFSVTDKYTAMIQLMLLMARRQSCRFFPLWTFFFYHCFDLSWFDEWT